MYIEPYYTTNKIITTIITIAIKGSLYALWCLKLSATVDFTLQQLLKAFTPRKQVGVVLRLRVRLIKRFVGRINSGALISRGPSMDMLDLSLKNDLCVFLLWISRLQK